MHAPLHGRQMQIKLIHMVHGIHRPLAAPLIVGFGFHRLGRPFIHGHPHADPSGRVKGRVTVYFQQAVCSVFGQEDRVGQW